MTEYNSADIKLLDSHLYKIKSSAKNTTSLILRLSTNLSGINESEIPFKLLLTVRQTTNPLEQI